MKRIFSIFFLFLYLFSVIAVHQYLKIPALLEHFTEHKQEDKSMTLWKFLCIHYAYGDINDADYEKDMKLPFKSFDNCHSTSIVTLLPENKFTFKAILVSISNRAISKFYKQFSGISFLNSIWQPPKFC